METKHRVSTKVLSLFLSVVMAAGVFSIAMPGLATKAKAAGAYPELASAFGVAFDAGYLSVSDWTGFDTTAAGRTVVIDNTTEGLIYDIVRALADVIVDESTANGAYNHNTKLAEHIIEALALNDYQANFIHACLPSDGDYASFDGSDADHTWNGTTANLGADANKKTMKLEVARSVGTAVVADYDKPGDVPDAVETSIVVTVNASLKAVASTNGSETGGVYVNASAAAAPQTTDLSDTEKNHLTALKNYLTYVNADPFASHYERWYNDGNKDDDYLYKLTPEQLQADYQGFTAVYPAAAAAEQAWIEAFVGQELMNDQYTFTGKCDDTRQIAEYKKYVDWIMPETSIPIEGYNPRDNYSLTDRASLVTALETGTALKAIMATCPAATVNLLVSKYGYNADAFTDYVDMIKEYIGIYDLQDMKIAHDWLLSHDASDTYSFTNTDSIFYSEAAFVAKHYSLTTDEEVNLTKTYYVPGDVYTQVGSPVAGDVASYYTQDPVTYTACTSSTVFNANTTYYTYDAAESKYTKVNSPSAANIATYYTQNPYTYTAAGEFDEEATYYTKAAGYVPVANPVDSGLGGYYEFFPDSYAAMKGIGNNEYIASAYGTFVLTSDEVVKPGKTYYTDATGQTEVANPVDANVSSYYEANGDACPITTEELKVIFDFYTKAYTLIWGDSTANPPIPPLPDETVAKVLSVEDKQEILDVYHSVANEYNSRSIATTAFLTNYAWFVKQQAGGAIEGMSVDALITLLSEAESKYTALKNAYTAFSTKDQATGKTYEKAKTKCRDYVDKIYFELYKRAYSYLFVVRTDYGSGINFQNYYAVKGELMNRNDTLLNWAANNTGNISAAYNRLNANGYNLTFYINTLKPDNTSVHQTVSSLNTTYVSSSGSPSISTMQTGVRDFTVSINLDSISKFEKSSFPRFGGDYADFARVRGNKNFTVSTANGGNLQKTVNKIDLFLSNDHFTELLGADEKGLNNLSEYIKQILVDNIFTDGFINTIVALVFPALSDLFNTTIPNMMGQFQGKSLSDFSGDAGGRMYLYFDGRTTAPGTSHTGRSTDSFVSITEWMGLNIFPISFGNYMQGQGSYVTSASSIGGWIKSANRDWNALDATSKGGNGDGKFDAKDMKKKFKDNGWTWGIDTIKRENYASTTVGFEQYCNARYNKTKTVLSSVFGAAELILKTLFTTANFSKHLDGSSAGQNIAYGYVVDPSFRMGGNSWSAVTLSANGIGLNEVEADITIPGQDLYHTLWIPIMEALGVNGDLTGSYTFPTVRTDGNFRSDIISGLLDPLYLLINKVAANPLESVLKLLPNLCFHLMNKSLNKLMDRSFKLSLAITGADLCDGSGAVAGILQWDWVTKLLIGALKNMLSFSIPINLGTMIPLDSMIPFDLTDINALVQGIIGLIAGKDEETGQPLFSLRLPGINMAKLAGAYTSKNSDYSTQGRRPNYNDGEGNTTFNGKRIYISASQSYQQVLYLLIDWVLCAATTPGFIGEVLNFIAKLSDSDPTELPGIIFSILNNVKNTDDVIAALVELFNYQDYQMFDISWYNKTAAGGAGTLNLTLSDFVYLKYQNDWTEEKAKYLYDNVDEIVNSVFNMIDPDLLAEYNGDANVWLNKFINSMFNNEGIWNVVDLTVKLGFMMAEYPNIAKLIKQQLKGERQDNYATDLLVWFNDFGYRYADDEDNAEFLRLKSKTELGDSYVTGEFLKMLDGQYYVYARERVKNEDASDGSETSVYYTYNANDPTTYTETKLRAYPNSLVNDSYKAGGTNSNFKNLIATDNYTVNDDGKKIYTWKVKLNATTAQFVPGYNANQWVTFVDGADNARAVFIACFCELIATLAPIFSLILSGDNLILFDAVTVNGYESYNGAFVPLLEALGVTGLPTQAEYNAMEPTEAFYTIVNLLFQALTDLLTDTRTYDAQGNVTGGKGAFQNLIDVLPHLFYFLQSDGLALVVKNLLMSVWTLVDTIRPLADIKLDQAIHVVLCRLLKKTYDTSAAAYKVDTIITDILDLVGIEEVPYTAVKAAKDKKVVDAIYGLSLSNLSLQKIFDLVAALTGLDLTPLTYAFEGMCIKNTRNGVTYGVKQMTSVTSAAANNTKFVTSVFKQPRSGALESYTLNYYGPDIITVTFSVLLDLLRYQNNAAALDELIGLTKDRLPGGGALIGETSAQGLLESLEVIFADKKHSVDIDRPNWDYLFEEEDTPVTGEGKLVEDPVNHNTFRWIDITGENDNDPTNDASQWANLMHQAGADVSVYHTLYNLEYSTDWTEDVATNVVATLESILDYVAAMMGSDQGFNAWITEFLNEKAFNANIIGLLVDYLAQVYDIVPEAIRGVIDHLLDVDMDGWEQSGMIVKYNDSSVETMYGLRNEQNPVEWTVTTYTVATEYDADEIYYKANDVEEGAEQTYSKVTVANAEAFAAGTFYTKSTESHSEDRFVITTSGDYKYVTTWTYGYADDQYEEVNGKKQLKAGAVQTYHATDEVVTFKKNAEGNWQKISVDEDTGKEKVKSSYTVNYNYKWFDEHNAAYVHDRATFLAAIKEIVHSADSLFGYIFLEDDYKIFYTAGDNMAHGQTSDDTDAIAINGVGLYGLLVVPILEALDVPLTKAQYDDLKARNAELAAYYADAFEGKPADFAFSPSKYYNSSTDTYDTTSWVNDMFIVFEDLADAILSNPLERILDILPGLIYFINSSGFTTCIRNTFGVLQDLLNTVNQILAMTGNDTEIGMVIQGIDLNKTTLSGLLDIVSKLVFKDDEQGAAKPKFHINDDIMKVCKEMFVGDLSTFVSANGYRSFSMHYSEQEDKKDMITILVALLVEVMTDKGDFVDPDNNYQLSPYDNAAAIAAMIGDGEYTDVVSEVVEVLTNPKDLIVDYKNIKWDYFDTTLDLANKEVPSGADASVTIPGFAFQYLNYTTQWKYDKAVTTVSGMEDLAVSILGMVDEEKYGDMTSLSELINTDTIFTAELAQSLLDTFSNLLFGADASIPKELLNLVGAVLGADLTKWDYTYQFASKLENGATVIGTENGLEYFTGHTFETVYNAAPATFDAEETYYEYKPVYTRADIDAFVAGETYYTKSGEGDEATYTAVAAGAAYVEGTRYFTKADTYIAVDVDEDDYAEAYENLFVATTQTTEVERKTYIVNDADTFASAIALILQPAGNLLAWLLFDDPYEFFVGNTEDTHNDILLTIPGANGYEKGLVLLLEALGCKGLGYATKYTSGNVDEATGLKKYDLFLYDLAHSIVNRLNELIEDPVGEIIGLIPELIYFINANGLGTVVNNLLAGPLALVGQVPSVLDLISSDDFDTSILFKQVAEGEAFSANKQYFTKSTVNGKDVYTKEKGLTAFAADKTYYYLNAGKVVDSLVAGVLNDALKEKLDKNGNGEVDEDEALTFSMDGVNLQWIMELVEGLTGLEITDLLAHTFDMFYIGKLNAYASKARTVAYKMSFDDKGFINGGNGDMADFLTILLSFAIDLVCYTNETTGADNGAAIVALINGDKTPEDSGYVNPALIQEIIKFIKEGFTVEYNDYDWFYFDENYALYEVVDGKLVRKTNADNEPIQPTYDANTAVTVPTNTFNYLTYQSDWTEDTAQYLVDHRNEIVAAVLKMAKVDGSISDIVKGIFDPAKDLYTSETLNSILNLVKPLASKLPAALLNIVGVILDVDLSVYTEMDGYFSENYNEVKLSTLNPYIPAAIKAFAPGETYYTYAYTAVEASAEFSATTTYYVYTYSKVDASDEFDASETYYTKSADGKYTVADITAFADGVTYYIHDGYEEASLDGAFAEGVTYYTRGYAQVPADATFNKKASYFTKTTYYTDAYTAVAADAEFDAAAKYYTKDGDKYVLADITEFAEGATYYTHSYVDVAEDAAFNANATYYTYHEINFTEGDRDQFVAELTRLLSPLNVILDWLLFGKDIQYFDKKIVNTDVVGPGTPEEVEILINLKGAEGYKYGLVPLLEALGVVLPEISNDDTTSTILPVLINNVMARLEAILNNPVDEILNLIPELLYFINLNGLATSVQNLLAGVFGLVENLASTGALNSFLGLEEGEEVDINGIVNNLLADLGITLDINKLDLVEILKVVRDLTKVEYVEYVAATGEFDATKTYYTKKVTPAEEEGGEPKVEYVKVDEPKAADLADYYVADEATRKTSTGIDLIEFCTEKKIDEFYFGKMEGYPSASTQIAFKMKYNALNHNDMAGLITLIVNLALEFMMDENNAKAIDALINGIGADGEPLGNTVSAIVAILKGLKELDEVEPEDIDWDYFLEEGELSATGITMPVSEFVYLDYNNLWTRDLATGLGAQLTDVVNEILALIAKEGEEPKTLADIMEGLVNIDSLLNADVLNTILDTIAPILYGEDSFLAEELLSLIGLVLGADLTQWNNSYRFEKYDAAKTYSDDAESGLKYRNGEITWYEEVKIEAFEDGVTYYTADEVAEGEEQTYTAATVYSADAKYFVQKTYSGVIYAIGNASDFASGLTYLLKPAQKLLGWLLLGNDYRFFVEKANGNVKATATDPETGDVVTIRDDKELLVIPGFEGYDLSLTLLLEALGCTGLKKASEYEDNEAALIKDIIDALIGRIDQILADPINQILDLIPELIYFINAGGLNAVVMNLAGSLLTVVEYINNSGLLGVDENTGEPKKIEIMDEVLDRTIIDKLVTNLLNDALKDTLDKDNNGELSSDEKLTFALRDVNLSWIIALAEKLTGLAIQDAVGHTYDLSKLLIGGVARYDSACTAYNDESDSPVSMTYKVVPSAETRGDVITIALSLVLDVLQYKNADATPPVDNAVVVAGLVADFVDDMTAEELVTVIDSAIAILKGWEDKITYLSPEWFYNVTDPETPTTDINEMADITLVDRTINYLTYGANWTDHNVNNLWKEETAKYLVNHIDDVLADVMKILGKEGTTVADILKGVFDPARDLYTADNLNAIVDLVKDLPAKLGDALVNIFGLVLDIHLDAYAEMHFEVEDINSKETFIAGLIDVLKPVYTILDWFLFGKDLAFLYDNDYYNEHFDERDLIHITGGYGYDNAIVPLFEALGIVMPAADKMEDAKLYEVLTNVCTKLETIIDDPVDEVLALIPNLIYFLNANGFSVVVGNLLASILGLIDTAAPIIIEFVGDTITISEEDNIVIKLTDDLDNILPTKTILNNLINGLLTKSDINLETPVDYTKVDLLTLVRIVEAATGLKIVDVLTENKIDKFFIGDIFYGSAFRKNVESANGKPSFFMQYSTEEEAHDMLTIVLNLIVEVLLYKVDGEYVNIDALCELVDTLNDNKDKIVAVVNLLTNPTEYTYKELNWNYFDETATLGDEIAVPKSKFIYLAYQNDWTYSKAVALDEYLVQMVDEIIAMIAKDDDPTTLADLVAGLVDIDELIAKPEYLNKILELVQKYLYGEDALLGQSLLDLIGLIFNAELTDWNDAYEFEAYDESIHTQTESATGLKYRLDGGKIYYGIATVEDFINGLCKILEPTEDILAFLLMGEDYGFFTNNEDGTKVLVRINGADGYKNGLALILEALGVEGLQPSYDSANEMLRSVLTALVNRVRAILADPINSVFDLLTELIYFINANGLSVAIHNLAGAAFNILDALDAAGFGGVIATGTDADPNEPVYGKILDVDALIEGLLKDNVSDEITFALDEINIQWVVDTLEVILAKYVAPFQINKVIDNSLYSDYPLQLLAIGKAVKYDSVSDLASAYKMVYGDGSMEGGASRADMITILLSFALDFLRNDTNKAAIEDMAGLQAGTVNAILAVISKYTVKVDAKFDWFYFDEDYHYEQGTDLTMFTPTIQYLSYASDWTEELADYLDTNLDTVVAKVLELAGQDSIAEIIKGVFDPAEKLYTAENLNKIVLAIANLTKDVQDVILNTAGLLLDVDLGAYKEMCTYDDAEGKFTECTKFADADITGRETFVAGLVEVIAPINQALDWLLFGDSYKFFNRISSTDGAVVEDLLVINGYEGYAFGLVPILEALGVSLPDCSDPTASTYNTANMISDVLSATLFRMEQILADPVEEVLALIPNLLYFINANGLTAAVNHLLGAPLALVEKVNPILDKLNIEIMGNTQINVNDLVNGLLADNGIEVEIDTTDLRLINVMEVVEALTGLELTDFIVENGIENFYLGQIVCNNVPDGEDRIHTSNNRLVSFRMEYSEDVAKDRSDMITVLVNYLLETVMYGNNAAVVDGWIGANTVQSVLNMLDALSTPAVPGNYHWNYFNEDSDEAIPEADYESITTPVTPFNNHLKYTTDWTQKTANTVYDNIDDVITAILTIVAKGDETKATTVAELLSGSFNLFTAENLNKIADLTKQLYDNFDATLVNLIGTVLGCDLTQWIGLHYTDEEIYDADTFTAGLYEILAPLSRVLDWLLFGESYGFFVADKMSGSTDETSPATTLINVGGAEGYIYGLAQILIALGIDENDLPAYTEETTCMTDVGGKTFLKAVLDVMVNRVVEILADPVDEVLELLPELLYFINANGVSTAAYNIAGGVLNAVNVLFEEGLITLEVDGEPCATIEDYLAGKIGVDIRNLDLEGIIGILEDKEVTKGIKINDVFKGTYTVNETTGEVIFEYDTEAGNNILEKFYCGTVTTYTYGGFHGWKMVAADGKQGDIITMLLSVLLDVLYYEDNEQAIADLINDLWSDVEFTKDNFIALKMILQNGAEFSSEFNPNWAYIVANADEWIAMAAEDQVALINELVTGLPGMKGRTQHYLEYDNNWNEAVVTYLDTNINDIVDLVINMVTKGEYLDLEKLIEGKLDIYTADTVNKIVDKIAGLLSKLDEVLTEELQDKLITTAGSLLGLSDDVIAKVTKPATETEVHDKATFVKALVDRFSGLDRVLNWLLFNDSYEFFTDLDDGAEAMIVISGGEGYKYGLAPILAALGVKTEIEATQCTTDPDEKDALTEVLSNVADRIDQLLYGADGCKTLNEVLALLPELIYFINTGAISDAVMNLLQPADELLAVVNKELGDGAVLGKDSVADFFSFTFNGTEYRLYDTTAKYTDAELAELGIERKNYNTLDFDFIFDLVKEKVGIDIANSTGTSADGVALGKVGDYIKSFYFGQLESYTSYGDVPGYKMNYSEADTRMDMLTILVTLVLDVFTSGVNEAAIVDLLGGDTAAIDMYNVIYSFLTGDLVQVEYQKFDWLFEEYADTGIIVSPMTEDGTIVNQSIYGPLYTRPMGEYMTKYLQLAINTYITLLGLKVNGKQVFTLDDILQELVGSNIYKNEYLNSIYNALLNLLTGLKEDTLGEELYNHIAYVLKEATRDPDDPEDVGVDLNYWFDEYTGPDEIEEGNQQQFIAEICEMLRPAYPVLRWLLAEDDIAFFNKAAGADQYSEETITALEDNDYLVLNGAKGYKYGIIPILEAINNGDTTNITSYSQYLADIEADPDAILGDILTPILCKVDDILADPINGVLNFLPAVVYFIGSNGLDTCFKNILGSVYTLLFNIDPLIANVEKLHDEDGTVSLYPLIGFDLRAINLETLLRQLLDSLKDSTGFSLSDLGIDLVNELSMGVIENYESYINEDTFFQDMYTMKYATEGTDVEGNKCDTVDFVTIILRLVLTFISDPDNKDAVEAMLKDKVSGDGYTLLCSLLDNFSEMVRTPDGKDKMMYTVYYVFYSALCAGVATNNAFAEFNGNYSFLNSLFNTSDLAFMRAIGSSLNGIFHMTDDEGNEVISPIIDETGVVPQGQIPFWQKIIEFFKQIINFFKNMFK
ncbi:MAG: hypothetical protein IJK89_07545 [Clostridia bacterium]|nr:hypothetical protein [Clostridia bacterium]